MISFRPLTTRVLVELDKPEEKTTGGIIIPDNKKEKPSTGIVISIGPDVKDVKNGERVTLPKFAGTELKVDDKECLLVDAKDILGVMDNE